MIDLDIDEIQSAVIAALETNDAGIVLQTLSSAMLKVGQLYEEEEYFLPELVLAGETMEEAMKILRPKLSGTDIQKKGKVVAATVKGDLHDIGKNIVGVVLACNGFEVTDLGVMVPCDKILDAALEKGADVIVMGCAGMAGYAQEIEQTLNIKVLDPSAVALKTTEAMVDLGLSHSKVGLFAKPPDKIFK